VARQATQKKAVDASKKKRTKEVRRKQEKEQEIARRVKAGERRSDVESEAPTEVDDMIFSEEEESQEVVVTSAERRDPTAMFAGDEHEAERRAEVLVLRKRAASADAIGKREAKRARSPRPSVASPVSFSPTTGAIEQARWSDERACTHASPGPVPACDSQWEDAPPAALIGASRAKRRGDPQAEQEPVGMTPPCLK